jgi:hypothetical protein
MLFKTKKTRTNDSEEATVLDDDSMERIFRGQYDDDTSFDNTTFYSTRSRTRSQSSKVTTDTTEGTKDGKPRCRRPLKNKKKGVRKQKN